MYVDKRKCLQCGGRYPVGGVLHLEGSSSPIYVSIVLHTHQMSIDVMR